jgi:hypothetical protein
MDTRVKMQWINQVYRRVEQSLMDSHIVTTKLGILGYVGDPKKAIQNDKVHININDMSLFQNGAQIFAFRSNRQSFRSTVRVSKLWKQNNNIDTLSWIVFCDYLLWKVLWKQTIQDCVIMPPAFRFQTKNKIKYAWLPISTLKSQCQNDCL